MDPAPETPDWQPSSHSCTSWSILCRHHWSTSGEFWRFHQRKRIPVSSGISTLKRCNVFWTRLFPAIVTGFAIGPCYIYVSPQDYGFRNSSECGLTTFNCDHIRAFLFTARDGGNVAYLYGR